MFTPMDLIEKLTPPLQYNDDVWVEPLSGGEGIRVNWYGTSYTAHFSPEMLKDDGFEERLAVFLDITAPVTTREVAERGGFIFPSEDMYGIGVSREDRVHSSFVSSFEEDKLSRQLEMPDVSMFSHFSTDGLKAITSSLAIYPSAALLMGREAVNTILGGDYELHKDTDILIPYNPTDPVFLGDDVDMDRFRAHSNARYLRWTMKRVRNIYEPRAQTDPIPVAFGEV